MSHYRFRATNEHQWKTIDGRHAMSFLINLEEIQKEIQVTDRRGTRIPLMRGFQLAIEILIRASRRGRKILFIGNGGSAAIASHQAVDYWKNGKLDAVAFNDSSLLTCIGNDCGYENVFAVPVQSFAQRGDVLMAISSSGKSPNILKGTTTALKKGCPVLTFSGFQPANPLRKLGQVNFYVPSNAYGIVEVTHLALIHSMLREIIYVNPNASKTCY